MMSLDRDSIDRDVAIQSCGECGEDSEHFRACADCKFTVARCEACGGNKSASREIFLHRMREHGAQFQLPGTETPADSALDAVRPRLRADCEPCAVCQAAFDSGVLGQMEGVLACGHAVEAAPNHCRPCPWVGCRHHALIEIAKAKPWIGKDRAGRAGRILRDARPTTIRLNRAPQKGQMGRRRGLHAQDATEVVQGWIDDAISHLEQMPHSCTLDVADAHPDGFPLAATAKLLGVTEAAIKAEAACASKLREGLDEYRDHAPQDHASMLARAQER